MNNTYATDYAASLHDPESFWAEQSRQLHWFHRPPRPVLGPADPVSGAARWFEGGQLNTSWLCLDYHVENGRAEQVALVYDSPVTRTVRSYTYQELLDLTSRFAGGLRDLGVEPGDRVIIYMPNLPEAVVAMLACARLGAVHSVVFGGFAPHELAVRIDDARPRVIVCASAGLEFDKVVPYKPLVDAAIRQARHQPNSVVVLQRDFCLAELTPAGVTAQPRAIDYRELLRAAPVAAVPLDATDPLYILYTSGTTGKPKGVVRDNGGHAVVLRYSLPAIYDVQPGDTFWAASDIGWAVGHSYIVYGPLLLGCTTVLFEGKPVRTPDAGTFWRVIEDHRVKVLFTAPTAIRAIKKEDPEGRLARRYDLSSLRALFVATPPPTSGPGRCWACRWSTTGGRPNRAGPCWPRLPATPMRPRPAPARPATPCRATPCRCSTRPGSPCPPAPPGWWPYSCPCRPAACPRSGRTRPASGRPTSAPSLATTSPATGATRTRTATSTSWAGWMTSSTWPATA